MKSTFNLALCLVLAACGGGQDEPQACGIFRAAYLESQTGDIRLSEPGEANYHDLLQIGQERAEALKPGLGRFVKVGDYYEEC